MTKDEIFEMARQAGFEGCAELTWENVICTEELEAFAKLVTEKAIKETLAQPEQEPVAWMDEDGDVLSASVVSGKGLRNIPLYTTPPRKAGEK